MYSSSSFPTHHIFFPPRLEVVAFQQDPNGLSTHIRDQLAFNHLFRQQAHRPACPALRGRRADYCHDPLLLLLIQGRSLARSNGIEQRSLHSSLLIALADLPNGLGGEHQVGAHRRRGLPLIHLKKRQSAYHGAHRLQTSTQQLLYLLPIFRGERNLKSLASAHASAIQPCGALHKCQR